MHWKRSAKAKQQQMFTEDASSVLDGGLTTATMSLPVWVDMPLHYKAVSMSDGEPEASAGDVDMSPALADDHSQACNDHLMQCDEPCQSLLLQTAPEQASGTAAEMMHRPVACFCYIVRSVCPTVWEQSGSGSGE